MSQKKQPTPVCEFRCDLSLCAFTPGTSAASPANAVSHLVSSVSNAFITVEGEPLFEEPGLLFSAVS